MGVDIGWVRPVGVTGDAHNNAIPIYLVNKTHRIGGLYSDFVINSEIHSSHLSPTIVPVGLGTT